MPRKKRNGWRRKGSRTSWSLFSEKTKSSLHLATPPTLKPRATPSPSTCLPFKNEEKLVFMDCGGKNLPSLKPVPHSILISCFSLFPTLALSHHQVPKILPPKKLLNPTGLALSLTSVIAPAFTLSPCSRPPGMSFYWPSLYGFLTDLPAPTPAPCKPFPTPSPL